MIERIVLKEDVQLFCATVKSFPDSIQESFMNMEKMLSREGRTFYGISFKNPQGRIVYKVAVTENYAGEGRKYGFESFILHKGRYLGEAVHRWKTAPHRIARTFDNLLIHPGVDYTFPCVEWYRGEDEVVCLVKVKSEE